jgi:polyhydroxybutyrate depolymerase
MRTLRLLLAGWLVAALLAGLGGVVAGQTEGTDRAAIPSVGCGDSEADVGDSWGSMDIDGTLRSWRLAVPGAHDGATPLPLVILLHGGGGSNDQISFVAGGGFSDERGFVAVAPQAREGFWIWNDVDWESVEPNPSMANTDIAFFDALIGRLGEDLCLDLARVYATGFSWGGVGLAALSCALEDRVAANAPVGLSVDFGDACVMDRPVPMLAFQSANDPTVPFDGGFPSPDPPDMPLVDWPGWDASTPERVANIAARNGCEPEPLSEMLTADIERLVWACPSGAEVELVITKDEGHGWPGNMGGVITMDIDATEMIWEFFEQHPMPE